MHQLMVLSEPAGTVENPDSKIDPIPEWHSSAGPTDNLHGKVENPETKFPKR